MKDSFSVLIVDDEKIDRDAYRLMFSRCMPEIEIAGEAENGLEAVRFCCQHKPDIVLMDIEMPVLGGMESIRLLRTELNDTNFVIISAYDYFEYAKEALDLGVLGFLVKPVSEAELMREMERVTGLLRDKRRRLQTQLDALGNTGQMPSQTMLLENLFRAVRENMPDTIRMLSDMCGRDFSAGTIVVGQTDLENTEELDAWMRRRMGKNGCLLWSGDGLFALLCGARARAEQQRALERLAEEIFQRFHARARLFAGGDFEAISEINRSLMQATSLVDTAWEVRVYDPSMDEHRRYPYPFDRELTLLECLQHHDRARCKEILDGMLCEVNSICAHDDFAVLKFVMYELLMTLGHQKAMIAGAGRGVELPDAAKYAAIRDAAELQAYFETCLDGLIGEEKVESGYEKISPILEYIRSNCNRDIPLSSVAQRFYFSQGYLGRLLKETTGLNYTEYLTQIRIERAADLLLNTRKSVGEISADVGFKDANYFTKVFKKVTGKTPQNYRSQKRG